MPLEELAEKITLYRIKRPNDDAHAQ